MYKNNGKIDWKMQNFKIEGKKQKYHKRIHSKKHENRNKKNY